MLDKILQLQQEQLDKLALAKRREDQRLQQQQQRLQALSEFDRSLRQSCSQTALYHHNRVALSQRMAELRAGQEQETALTQSDVQRRQQLLLKQFGKVKGLEQLQQRQQRAEQVRAARKERQQLDEWLNARHHSRNLSGR